MSRIILSLCVLLCCILAIAPFLNIPVMPTNIAFISSYGAYLSGTVAPCIALFAYIGVLKAIRLQREQLEQLSEETKKQEIIRGLEKYDSLIKESLLNHSISIEIEGHQYDLYQVMTMLYFETTYQQAVKFKNNYFEKKEVQNIVKEAMVFEAVAAASLYFKRMSEYISEYKRISKDNLVVGFYYNKYQSLAIRLHTLGYIESDTYDFWEKKLNKSLK
ncbi:hypothetical protein [Litorilituus lipolyticus]|uniref:DUF4760 domain-containing protein n=1 Tax=Litorilituus lipolyticus TaxID=2491017 RepID=A0A502L8V2_9GAMM|nr:hypothetical protein [Litorilituus lipolyticus]TPH18493.1 hypothetical protein EPA86_01645 [Litorilituus lipolyticus]